MQLVVDGDDVDPVVQDQRRSPHRRTDARVPVLLAGVRIERIDHGQARRHEQLPAVVGQAAAEFVGVARLLRGQRDTPQQRAGVGIEGRDGALRILGEHLALGDDRRRRQDARRAAARPDVGRPDDLRRGPDRQVVHGIVREAAGLRPGLVHRRRRQHDLHVGDIAVGFEVLAIAQHGNPLARQRRLLLVEDIAAGKGDHQQGGGKKETGIDHAEHARHRTTWPPSRRGD